MPKGKGNNNGHHDGADCVGQNCEWVTGKNGGNCVDGSGGCQQPHFCEADESSFHDKTLQDATKKLNRILAGIPADSTGRKLKFWTTNMGTFLAWTNVGGKPPKGKVVRKTDDDKTVAKALRLKAKYLTK
jgi:hypothetical protein